MKNCSRHIKGLCVTNNPQPLVNFSINNQQKSGLHPSCRSCKSAALKERRNKNPEKFRVISRVYHQNNKEKVLLKGSRWRHKNKGRVNAISAKRRAYLINATPKWINKDQLEAIDFFYKAALNFQSWTKIKFEVDHVIPLINKNVCGLHVPWNLQILIREQNLKKSNSLQGGF